jgi:hypothetical protein
VSLALGYWFSCGVTKSSLVAMIFFFATAIVVYPLFFPFLFISDIVEFLSLMDPQFISLLLGLILFTLSHTVSPAIPAACPSDFGARY